MGLPRSHLSSYLAALGACVAHFWPVGQSLSLPAEGASEILGETLAFLLKKRTEESGKALLLLPALNSDVMSGRAAAVLCQ